MRKRRTRPRARAGRREDIGGLYVRSSWEANVCRILNEMIRDGEIVAWEYEPEEFWFPVKRGCVSYKPDFKIWEAADKEPYYIEVKGWMDSKSRTKLKRMAKYYPHVRIDLVDLAAYRALEAKYRHRIPTWEDPALENQQVSVQSE